MSMNTPETGFEVGEILSTETGKYKIRVDLKGGGRARTYLATVVKKPRKRGLVIPKTLRKGSDAVIKIPRIDPTRDAVQTQDFVKTVHASLDQEIIISNRLHDLESVARTVDSHALSGRLSDGAAVHLTVIVQEYAKGVRLDEYLKRGSPGTFTANAWIRLATSLAAAVKAFHQRGVCHQDIWPHNIIMVGPNPVFIDFGEAALRKVITPPYGPKRPNPHAYMAPEIRDGEPWPSRRADLYSLGGVLYFLAVGEDPPAKLPKDNDALKDFVTRQIKKLNPALLDKNWGVPDITARCLRYDRKTRVRNAEALLQEIRTFGAPHVDLAGTLGRLRRLGNRFLRQGGDHLFKRMAAIDLRQVECRMQDMADGVLDITGDHEEIVTALTQYLSVLRRGDEYLAVTVPKFWAAGNLGVNGRYIAMTRQIAMGGVHIRRLFLLTKSDRRDPMVKRILKVHHALSKEVNGIRKKTRIDARYALVPPHERELAVKQGEHWGIWIRKGTAMEVVPFYDGPLMTSLRLRSINNPPPILRQRLDKYWQEAKPLEK